jgi:hypothetical protein
MVLGCWLPSRERAGTVITYNGFEDVSCYWSKNHAGKEERPVQESISLWLLTMVLKILVAIGF